MAAPNFQTSAKHFLYLAVKSEDPTEVSPAGAGYAAPHAVTNYADGTNVSGGVPDDNGIDQLIIGTAQRFVLSENVRDLNEDASENRVDVTTRADAKQGLSSEVITTTTAGFNYEMLYKANDTASGAANDLMAAFTDVAFRALLLAKTEVKEIYAVDFDREISATAADNHGMMGRAGNWTISLSRAKAVQGVVFQTATFSLSSYGEWLVHDGVSFIRVGTEIASV